MNILVPVDGSPYSEKAVETALDFVRAKAAEIHVISVIPDIPGMDDHEISPARRERHVGQMEEKARQAVEKAVGYFKSQGAQAPATAATLVAPVSVPDTILDFAEEKGVDLIILGTRGTSGSERYRMGSVATKVVKYSPSSVYLVKLRESGK